MKYIYITSARRNPDKNPVSNVDDEITKYYEKETNFKSYTYFISFTVLPKIGINPKNEYATPIGIYTYPLRLMYEDFIRKKLPFADDRPFIQVLKIKPKVKILSEYRYNKSEYEVDKNKLKNIFDKLSIDPDGAPLARLKLALYDILKDFYPMEEVSFDKLEEATHKLVSHRQYKNIVQLKNKYVGYIWYLSYLLSFLITTNFSNNKNTVKWNYLLRKVLGYGCVIDRGFGFIHPNEPTQAVFLSTNAFTLVDTIDNKRHTSGMPNVPDYLRKFRNIPTKEQYDRLLIINPDLALLKGKNISIIEEDGRLVINGFTKLNLKGITLHNFIIKGRCQDATLIGCSLKGNILNCNIQNCTLQSCNICKCDIKNSKIKDGYIYADTKIEGSSINSVFLSNGLSYGMYSDGNVYKRSINIKNSQIKNGSYESVIFENCTISKSDGINRYTDCVFKKCNIQIPTNNDEIFNDCKFI